MADATLQALRSALGLPDPDSPVHSEPLPPIGSVPPAPSPISR
jgi:hypothetical protein